MEIGLRAEAKPKRALACAKPQLAPFFRRSSLGLLGSQQRTEDRLREGDGDFNESELDSPSALLLQFL